MTDSTNTRRHLITGHDGHQEASPGIILETMDTGRHLFPEFGVSTIFLQVDVKFCYVYVRLSVQFGCVFVCEMCVWCVYVTMSVRSMCVILS